MARSYAIMRVQKIKSATDMMQRYFHNERIYNVYNADITKQHLNEELVSLHGQSYDDVYQETIRRHEMEGSITKKVRKDAVKGMEIMLSYSDRGDATIDVDAWKQECLQWLQETFNPPENTYTYTDKDGNIKEGKTDNVRAVHLHMDEHSPHIHAFVVPIDDRGRLNAHYYSGNRSRLIQLQNSYSKRMEKFGLARGVPGSVASYKETARYYAELQAPLCVELPEVLPGETATEYKTRADLVYQNAMVHYRDDIAQLKQEVLEAGRSGAEKERKYKQAERLIVSALEVPSLEERVLRPVLDGAKENEAFNKAVEEHPDRDAAESARAAYQQMVSWQLGRDAIEAERNRKKRKEMERSGGG